MKYTRMGLVFCRVTLVLTGMYRTQKKVVTIIMIVKNTRFSSDLKTDSPHSYVAVA